ncbi:MAG: hypothetical protein NVSMB9_16600 [Isosphaeraceae bacterium]
MSMTRVQQRIALSLLMALPLLAVGFLKVFPDPSGVVHDIVLVSLIGLVPLAASVASRGSRVPAQAAEVRRVDEEPSSRRTSDASGRRYRALSEMIPHLVWSTEPEGGADYFNSAWSESTGLSLEQSLGWGWVDAIHPEDRESTRLRWKQALASGRPYEIEYRLVCASNRSYRWHLSRGLPVHDSRGRIVQWLGTCTDIDNQKQAEQALRISEARFRALVEQSPLSTQVLAADGTTLRVNRAWERLWGVTLKEIAGYNLLQDQQLIERGMMPYIEQAFAGEGTVIPPKIYCPDRGPFKGKTIWVRAFIYPVKDEAGEVREIVLVHEDITERVQAKAALVASEARFQAFMNHLPAVAFLKDEEGRYVWGNEAWARQHRHKHADPLGCSDAELWPEAAARRFHESDRNALESRETLEVIEPVITDDGSLIHWMTLKFTIEDRGGRLLLGGIALDITERVRVEERLRQQLAFTSAVTANMAEGLYALDEQGCSTFLNPAAERMLGWTQDELNGRNMHEVVHFRRPDNTHYSVDDCPLLETIRAAKPIRGEEFFIRKDDTGFPVDYSSSPILVDGRGRGAVVTFHDITDRLRSQEELRQAKEAAEKASQAKDQFLAVLSHELRTPLTPVLVEVSALLDDPSTPEAHRPTLILTKRNVELEARIIDDLLDVTRIAQGKLRLDTRLVDAHELIHQAIGICRDEIVAAKLRIDVKLLATRHHVEADPARIQQIAWNLIKNAAKFTPVGGSIHVRTCNTDEGRLVMEVSDTGIGIAPEALPGIFAAFEQADPSITKQFGGLGLGLAISRSLAEAHGGTLRASSRGRGKGATFTFDVPTVPTPRPTTPETSATPTEILPRESSRILLVEDNADTLRVMSRLLKSRGHGVTTATGVDSALEAEAAEGPFDLIISDIGLPDGSGLELMKQIRRRSGARGIALSGYGMEEDLRRSQDAGFVEHLTKPIDFAKLEAAIQRVVANQERGIDAV